MIDVIRPPYPWDTHLPRQSVLRVVILIVVIVSTIVLVARGIAPGTAVAVIGAAGVAAAEIAARLLTPSQGSSSTLRRA
ncbi:hypothetical protein [Nocardia sp. NPDC059239]|uniref:hypothetical protein n=1 Tax=unclassified Nocardia TaxID=2637762 RepID=UPI00368780AB